MRRCSAPRLRWDGWGERGHRRTRKDRRRRAARRRGGVAPGCGPGGAGLGGGRPPTACCRGRGQDQRAR
ncbi:hypothetical protein FRC98_05560 [Lujinxingia vulgaris]|uniref:Uncharacterized protein n=1 Tax=Lujinxingia vulgaris TaxID=2600176 RepID=A0A5C6X9R6_9DELT|nr:hypothetical protein FRC98_05560 [Lujinxingia vulgaris]